jgi:hypothetical protein
VGPPLEVEIREAPGGGGGAKMAAVVQPPPPGERRSRSVQDEGVVVPRARRDRRRDRQRQRRPPAPAVSPPVVAPSAPEGVAVPAKPSTGGTPAGQGAGAPSGGHPGALSPGELRALAGRLAAEHPTEDGVLRPDHSLRPPPPPPKYPLEPTKKGGLVYKDFLYTAHIADDGTVRFQNKPVVCYPDGRCAPNDPDILKYEQARFLEATFEVRAQMSAKARAKNLGQALADLPQRLERVWVNQASSLEERHRLLFELWDECNEPRKLDEADLSGGRYARAAILAFIRRHLPKGSALAYTVEELEALNRRRTSRERFAPYGK